MKIKIFIFGMLLLLLFVSCHSNLISKDGEDCLYFSLLPEKRGDNVFSVKKISKNYSVRVIRTRINLQNFKLRPNMEYEIINNSASDAANGKLLIRTDENSDVIYADKISCD